MQLVKNNLYKHMSLSQYVFNPVRYVNDKNCKQHELNEII